MSYIYVYMITVSHTKSILYVYYVFICMISKRYSMQAAVKRSAEAITKSTNQ